MLSLAQIVAGHFRAFATDIAPLGPELEGIRGPNKATHDANTGLGPSYSPVHAVVARMTLQFPFRERFLPFCYQVFTVKNENGLGDQYSGAVASALYCLTGQYTEATGLLFHYTGLPAFESMMKTGELWASHCSSMNDFKEIEHAWDVVLRRLPVSLKQRKQQHIRIAKSVIVDNPELFVISFSKNGNALSQWDRYAPHGVAVGFSSQLFSSFDVGFSPYRLGECKYDPDEHIRLLTPLVDKLAVILAAAKDDPETIRKPAEALRLEFMQIAPFIKHPGHREEAEVRLVSDGVGFEVHRGKNAYGERRYIKISFDTAFAAAPLLDLPIWRVITSPRGEPDTSVAHVRDVMKINRRKWAAILHSGIPLR